MGAETKLVLVCSMLLGFLVRSCWCDGLCELELQQQNKLYKFNLASPLRDHPHGVLSEDGFYKIAQNDSETGTETKFWFQLCEQMVFNHDQPVCFRCQTCGGPSRCGLTCSALMAKRVAGYYICTTLGCAANFKVSLIDMKNPGKGVRMNMSASTTDGDCSLSVSVYCNANGVQAPMSVNKSGDCNYITTMMHPAGCPAVTSIGGKGLGWLNTLVIVLLCILAAYLLTGIVYRFFVLGIHGKEVIPNLDFWLSVPRRIQNGSEYILIKIVGAYYRVRYGPYTRV